MQIGGTTRLFRTPTHPLVSVGQHTADCAFALMRGQLGIWLGFLPAVYCLPRGNSKTSTLPCRLCRLSALLVASTTLSISPSSFTVPPRSLNIWLSFKNYLGSRTFSHNLFFFPLPNGVPPMTPFDGSCAFLALWFLAI